MPILGVIPPDAWRTQPWANGAGVTHEITRWGDAPGFDARLSVAELIGRSPFSHFAGYDRWLAPDGEVTLHLPDGPRRLARGEALAFPGEIDIVGEPAAPTWDLNVMVRRGVAWSAELVAAGVERLAPPGLVAVFAFSAGAVEVAGHRSALSTRATLLAASSTPFSVSVEEGRCALVHLGLRPSLASLAVGAPKQVSVPVEGDRIVDWDSFHDEFARAFGFPSYYGRNLDAWNDCMGSLDARADGMSAVSVPPGGTVVIDLRGARALSVRCPQIYAALVECAAFVNWSRREMGLPAVLALSFYG